jgi:2-keto-3-deoxy-L-fuconate dehydrogenase
VPGSSFPGELGTLLLSATTSAIGEICVPMSGEFGGRVVLVTGGASGIGLATAQLFAAEGAFVVVFDRILEAISDPLVGVAGDVTDDTSVVAAAEFVRKRYGRLDILINCAGIGTQGTVEQSSDDDWRKVFDVNVFGMARVSRAFLPLLRASDAASVVNVCSVAATVGLPNRAAYSASKGAVLSLTRAMAVDHLADGIRVNCVNPGTADTPWVGRLLAAAADPVAERVSLNARQPTGRLVTAAEVAHAIRYLASPLAGATTGAALAVDGGMQGLRPSAPVIIE